MNRWLKFLPVLVMAGVLLEAAPQRAAADSLVWRPDTQTLDVDLQEAPLIPVLDRLATKTGWHIYLEPTPGKTITTKFAGLSRGEAMRVLLGDLNYAFAPQPDGPTRLFVFRSSRDAATRLIRGVDADSADRRIANELVIKIMPGTDIEELAKKLGAKITGRLDKIGVYRLEFEDDKARDAAREKLLDDPGVEGVDYNFTVDRPPSPQAAPGRHVGPPQLTLKPPTGDGRVVVGLIDTAVQPLGNGLDRFLLPTISVAGEGAASATGPTHGTSMANTLLLGLQQATGGATSAQILPVDVYGGNPLASTYDVAVGIMAAVNGGANVINLSLGSTADSAFLRSVIESVSKSGIPIFAAAGNQPVTTPTYPAAYPQVTAVTAGQNGQPAPYANVGSFVDVMAPGTSVVTYNGQTYLISGTSAASALVAGQAAGVAAAKNLSPTQAASQVQSQMPFQPATR